MNGQNGVKPSHWSAGEVVADGVSIHYTRTGKGEKPPLVLAHGFSDHGLCWLPVARELEAEYDVILPDARGHGLSARVGPGESVDMAADLAGLIRELGLEQPILGGHSMGAHMSADMVARFPGLVRALILEDPAWRDPEPAGQASAEAEQKRQRRRREQMEKMQEASVEELVERCRRDNPGWPEVELLPWAEAKKQFDPGLMQAPRFGRREWRETVPALGCPTLLITADPDEGAIVTPEIAREVSTANGSIRPVRIDGAGHCIRRDRFGAYMEVVRKFLEMLSA